MNTTFFHDKKIIIIICVAIILLTIGGVVTALVIPQAASTPSTVKTQTPEQKANAAQIRILLDQLNSRDQNMTKEKRDAIIEQIRKLRTS
jgi:predicted PurR-regulated permease PerM